MQERIVVGVIFERYDLMGKLRGKSSVKLNTGEEVPVITASESWEPEGSGSYPKTRDEAISVYRHEVDRSIADGQEKRISFLQVNSDIIEELIGIGKISSFPKRRTTEKAFIGLIQQVAAPLL